MNDVDSVSNKWEREFKIAELLAESEEQRRFDEFYEKIPNLMIRHKTQESHLPLIFISSAKGKRHHTNRR